MTRRRFFQLAIATLCLTLTAGCSARPVPIEPESTPIPSYPDQAIAHCEELVSGSLKAPATAQYQATAAPVDGATYDLGPWTITGTVDAENSFGALLRMTWGCSSSYDEAANLFTSQVDYLRQ